MFLLYLKLKEPKSRIQSGFYSSFSNADAAWETFRKLGCFEGHDITYLPYAGGMLEIENRIYLYGTFSRTVRKNDQTLSCSLSTFSDSLEGEVARATELAIQTFGKRGYKKSTLHEIPRLFELKRQSGPIYSYIIVECIWIDAVDWILAQHKKEYAQ